MEIAALLDKKLRKVIAMFFNFSSVFLDKKYKVMLHLAATFQNTKFIEFGLKSNEGWGSTEQIENRTLAMFKLQKQSRGVVLSKDILTTFTKFTGKHLCWCLLLNQSFRQNIGGLQLY